MTATPLLSVEGVTVDLPTPRGPLRAVDGVDLTLAPGSTLGIVGESGCGKTMLSRAILQLLPKRARLGGRVLFDGRDLVALRAGGAAPPARARARRRLPGPDDLAQPGAHHRHADHRDPAGPSRHGQPAAATRAASSFWPRSASPRRSSGCGSIPHQLSGGMRQRVAIAIALSCEPKLLIADEPTTALDVTVQAQILDLLAREQQRRHMAMILITHDLGVVAGRTDEVAVMYAGRVVERAPTPELFTRMRMPYTEALLAAIPKLDSPPHTPLPAIAGRPPDPTRPLPGCSFAPRCRYADERCRDAKPPLADPERAGALYACWHPLGSEPEAARMSALLSVENLVVEYAVGGKTPVGRVRRQPATSASGETLGLVGEFGLRQVDAGPRRPAAAPPDRAAR